MPKLQEVNAKGRHRFFLTIPAPLVKRKGWKQGQELFFSFNERGNIELRE